MRTLGLLMPLVVVVAASCSINSGSDGEWHSRAPMPTPRSDVAIASYKDLIYAIGGLEADGSASDTVEVYDPESDSWREVAPLPEPRYASAAFGWGAILLVGGFDADGTPRNTGYAYDPEADSWSEVRPLNEPRGGHVGAKGFFGNPVIIGGEGRHDSTREPVLLTSSEWISADGSIEIDNWVHVTGALDEPRVGCALGSYMTASGHVQLPVLLVSGGLVAGDYSASVETGAPFSLQEASSMEVSRAYHAAAGTYVFGGVNESGVLGSVERFHSRDDSWEELASMPTARHGMGAVAVDDAIYVIGGSTSTGNNVTGANEVFTP